MLTRDKSSSTGNPDIWSSSKSSVTRRSRRCVRWPTTGSRLPRTVGANGDVFDLEPGHSPDQPQVRRIKNPALNSQAYDAVMHDPRYFGHRRAAHWSRLSLPEHKDEHEASG